jgi:hypothetical protein
MRRPGSANFIRHRLGLFLIHIQNAHARTAGRKLERDGTANAATGAGDDGNLAIQSKFR